jgi:hypothetical protein
LLLGPALVLGYLWYERRYWQQVDSAWRASSPSSSPSAPPVEHAPKAAVVTTPQPAEPVVVPAVVEARAVAVEDAPAAVADAVAPTPAAEPVPQPEEELLDAARQQLTESASPLAHLSDVDREFLAQRLIALIQTQRVNEARAADPTNYLASSSALTMLDEATKLAREADERVAAQEAQLEQLGARVLAVERHYAAELDAARRLQRFERAALGLSGALQEQRPFGVELQTLTAAAQAIELPALQHAAAKLTADDARRGVLQTAALNELFVDIVEASKVAESLQRASSAPIVGSDAPAWWQRGYAAVVRNATVWPSGVPAGDGPVAVAARARWHLEQGELAKSVGELQRIAELPDVKSAAAPFLSEAERRLKLENVVALALSDIDRLLKSASHKE